MSFEPTPPSWRLPQGVNASLWQYAHTQRLADDEDALFQNHPLFEADSQALDARFAEPGPLGASPRAGPARGPRLRHRPARPAVRPPRIPGLRGGTFAGPAQKGRREV